MAVVQLLVELPEGMSLASLQQLLEGNGIVVREFKRIDDTNPPHQSQPSPRLSPTELEVLRAFAQDVTKEDIADLLHVSVSTVKTHTQSIFRKLGVHTRCCAVLQGLRLGLLTMQDLFPPPKAQKSPERVRKISRTADNKGRGRGV